MFLFISHLVLTTQQETLVTTCLGLKLLPLSETVKLRQAAVDDFLHELPEDMPDLELGDSLLQTLGAEAEELFESSAPLTKREDEDEILKDLVAEYDVENIKTTMDETEQVPESIYFFYGSESQIVLEFIGLT